MCDPPISITSTGWENQVYTLTAVGESYTHPAVVVNPAFCPYTVTYLVNNLPNDESAVTQN